MSLDYIRRARLIRENCLCEAEEGKDTMSPESFLRNFKVKTLHPNCPVHEIQTITRVSMKPSFIKKYNL